VVTKLSSKGYSIKEEEIWNALDENFTCQSLKFTSYMLEKKQTLSMLESMNLVDIIELLSDWKAATGRCLNGDIYKSIEINQSRFGYTDEIKKIFINTLKNIVFD
jgi:hypothetical protein